jgi:hypothetical protein
MCLFKGETSWKPLPFLIFGIFSIMASISTTLLPETLNRNLPENIQDAHNANSFKGFRKSSANQMKAKLKIEQQNKEESVLLNSKEDRS